MVFSKKIKIFLVAVATLYGASHLNAAAMNDFEIGAFQQTNSIEECKRLFEQWDLINDDERIDLASNFVNLIIASNNSRSSNNGKFFKIPNKNLMKSLGVLLDANHTEIVKTLLDQYKGTIPVYKVSKRKMSNQLVFMAEWYIKLLMKENSHSRVTNSVDLVNQLTLFGIFNSRFSHKSILLGEAVNTVITFGLGLPYWAYRLPKGNKLAKIRDEYLQFLDENGYDSVASSLRESTEYAKMDYDRLVWTAGAV